MNERHFHKELIAAKDIALKAWHLIAHYYDSGVEVEHKPDHSPVSIADTTSNQFIVEELARLFPQDGVVSEEDQSSIAGKRIWYIDPIDGTKGFVKRNGHFAIHIGFCQDESPTLGVVYWPSCGDIYYGLKGEGAWRENLRGIRELTARPVQRGLIAVLNGDQPPRELEPIYSKLGVTAYHNSGSEGLRIMKIAENIADIRISEKIGGFYTWDLCAPQAILEAAGGIVKYLDGRDIHYAGQRDMGKRYVASYSRELIKNAITLSGPGI